MKIAIISDCHFGFNEDALPQAREAMLIAIKMKSDLILLPGDIYDTRVPKQETVHETVKLYHEIGKAGIGREDLPTIFELRENSPTPMHIEGMPILAIWGTHERRSKGLSNIIQIMDAANLLVNLHARTIILRKGGEEVAIQGLGGVPEEYFKRTLEVARFLPTKGAFNIFVFHQNLQELMPIENEGDVSIKELPEGFDLYVNGHIHWNHDMVVSGRRLLVSGSTVVTQMKKNEEKEKGFYLFDTVTKNAEFVKIPSRPFYFREIEFKDATSEEVEFALDAKLLEITQKGDLWAPLVKIKLLGTIKKGALSSLNLDGVTRKYSKNAKIHIDKDFSSAELKDRIDQLRKIRSEGKNAKELGMEILMDRLSEKKLEMKDPRELFELLAEGEIDEAMENI